MGSILGKYGDQVIEELKGIMGNKKKKYADTIIRNGNGDFLLLQRAYHDDFMAGKWSLAGGKIDEGETPEVAAERELLEETAIVAKPQYLTTVKKDDCTINYFCATVPNDVVIVLDNEEHYRYEFVPAEKLDRYDLLLDLSDVLQNTLIPMLPEIEFDEPFRPLSPEEEIAALSELDIAEPLDMEVLDASLINKSFDDGLISDDDFLLYQHRQQAFETVKKAYDNDQIAAEKFFDLLEKAKHYEFVKVNRDGKTFFQYREVGTDKIEDDVETGTSIETNAILDLKITKYSEKSILITGNTYKNLALLRQAKEAAGGMGTWNKALGGWVFPLFAKDKIMALLAEKMTIDTYDETKAKEAAIEIKNSVDVGTTVTVDGHETEVEQVKVKNDGSVGYIVESEEHGQKVEVSEAEVAISPADDKKAVELINNATEENRFKTGKQLFGKEEGEKPVSEAIEQEGQKERSFDVKEFTTRNGAKVQAIDCTQVKGEEIQLMHQKDIGNKPKPFWCLDVNEKHFWYNRCSLPYTKLDDEHFLVDLNGNNPAIDKKSATRNDKARFAVVSADQLVAMQDYYLKNEKLKHANEKIEYLKAKAEEIKGWNESRMKFYRPFDYAYTSKQQQKKYTKEQWDALSIDEKAAEFPYMAKHPYKWSKLTTLKDGETVNSSYQMFKEFSSVDGGRLGSGGTDVWLEYRLTSKALGYKKNDLECQVEENESSFVKGRETSYGDSNTKDVLLESHGVKVKRQNGNEINEKEINQIKDHLNLVYESFGDRSSMSREFGLKISHAGDKHMHAMTALGIYYPAYRAIGVTDNHHGKFGFTLAHEYAHFFDNYVGKKTGRHYASDDYNSLAGKIANTFRDNMNDKANCSNYLNRTCECFARAFEQYHAMKHHGDNVIKSQTIGKPYVEVQGHLTAQKFNELVKPLIEQFLSENDHLLKSAFNELNMIDINNNFELIKAAFDENQIGLPEFIEAAKKFDQIVKGDPSHGGKLVKKTVVNKMGKRQTEWVKRGDEADDNKQSSAAAEPVAHSKKVLSAFAAETPAAELKRVINESSDEKLRAAAHAELDRREKKEKPQEKKDPTPANKENPSTEDIETDYSPSEGLKELVSKSTFEQFLRVLKTGAEQYGLSEEKLAGLLDLKAGDPIGNLKKVKDYYYKQGKDARRERRDEKKEREQEVTEKHVNNIMDMALELSQKWDKKVAANDN